MRLVATTLLAIMITSAVIAATKVDPNAMLAEWNGGGITVSEYIKWWQRIDPRQRPQLKTPEQKRAFLDNMIDAYLMLAEAESLGLESWPTVHDWVAQRTAQKLKNVLNAQATKGRVRIDSSEVEELLEKRHIQITARHIIVPTYERALAILDSIKAGVPFEELAIRYSTDAAGPRGGYVGAVRWGDFSERWCQHAFALEPGEVSEPFMVEKGYAIVKVETKTRLEPQNSERERELIRNYLYRQRYFDELRAFRDSLRLAYQVDLDESAVVDLAAHFAKKMKEMGLTSTVIDVDVVPDLTEAERNKPVVTFKGGSITYGEVVDMILAQPYVVRPRLDDPDQLITFISRHLVDTLSVLEAVKRGLDKSPEVSIPLEKIRQKRLIRAFYRYLTQDVEVPEDSLRAYFEAHRTDYTIEPGHVGSKIVVGTKEAADSVMMRLEAGEAFEDIARERSRDPFTAPRGGDMGFMPIGKDPEFDEFFAQMQVGERRIFRSVEGYVVLWLRERRESHRPTFEEVRDKVLEDLLPMYRDRVLAEWISRRRQEVGVKVSEDLLAQVEVTTSE